MMRPKPHLVAVLLIMLSAVVTGCAGAGGNGVGGADGASGMGAPVADGNGPVPGPPPGWTPGSSATGSSNSQSGASAAVSNSPSPPYGSMSESFASGLNSGGASLPPGVPLDASESTQSAPAVPSLRDLSRIQRWSIATATGGAQSPSAGEDLLIVSPADSASSGQSQTQTVSGLHEQGVRRVVALLSAARVAKGDAIWSDAWTATDTENSPSSAPPKWLLPASGSGQAAPTLYNAAYWDADWRTTLQSQLSVLSGEGYDGVCLSDCDDFSTSTDPKAASDMASLIVVLANAARAHNKQFIVLVSDAELLPESLGGKQRRDYLSAIDGIVAHDVFYENQGSAAAESQTSSPKLLALSLYRQAKKAIMVTQTTSTPDKVQSFVDSARKNGFLPGEPVPGGSQ